MSTSVEEGQTGLARSKEAVASVGSSAPSSLKNALGELFFLGGAGPNVNFAKNRENKVIDGL